MLMLHNLRKTALVLAITGATGVAGAVQAANSLTTLSRGTPLLRGDTISGALSLSHHIHVTIALKLRHPDNQHPFKSSPHQTMSKAQLPPDHLPKQAREQE